MFSRFKKNKSRAFSLVETLVVVFIVGVLCSVVLLNYRDSQNKYNLNQSIQRLSADIRRAQNLALVGQAQGANVPLGYGVYVSGNTSYFIFYNLNGGNGYFNGSLKLDNLVNNLSGVTFSVGVGKDVYFVPPDPTTYINGQAPNGNRFQAFTLAAGSYSKTITVYDSGRIDIQ